MNTGFTCVPPSPPPRSALPAGRRRGWGVSGVVGAWALLAWTVHTHAQTPTPAPPPAALPIEQALALTRASVTLPPGARVEVVAGQLDPRLRLAPCSRIDAYLPPGARAWGRTRVGLRCSTGSVPWNVYLPVTVKVWAPALVTRQALGAGAELAAADVQVAVVDVAESASPALTDPAEALGRKLAQALPPGTPLRADHLRLRQWFATGESVSVRAVGTGFAVSSTAEALSPGLEGQLVRVRTESGRVLQVWPVGDRLAEIRL